MTFATIVLPCLDYYHLLIEGLYLPLCLLFILVVVLLVHLFRDICIDSLVVTIGN